MVCDGGGTGDGVKEVDTASGTRVGLVAGTKGVGLAPAVISLVRSVAVVVTVTPVLPVGAPGDNWELPAAEEIGMKGWGTPDGTPSDPWTWGEI